MFCKSFSRELDNNAKICTNYDFHNLKFYKHIHKIDYKNILKYMFFCHRLPERSFFFKGYQFPICARCTGILIGYFIGIIYLLFNYKIHFLVEILLMLPLIIDGSIQYYTRYRSTNIKRLITGILAGTSVIFLLRTLITLWLQCIVFLGDYILINFIY